MTDALRRLKLSPRAFALAGAAILVFLIWRRGSGGDGGTGIEGPLTTIPGGTEEFPADESGVPITIPLPPTGGIIHIPGEDPILIEPRQPPATPTPKPPPPKSPTKPTGKPYIIEWGRLWRRNQLAGYYAEWRRRHKGRDTPAAWRSYLRRHRGVARFFGIPVPAAASRPAAPRSQPDPRQAAAAGSPPNTPRAMAPIPKPRAAPRAAPRRRVTTVSGAHVVMPGRALRGPRSPRRRPIVGGIAYGSGGGSPGLFYLSLAQAAAKRRRRRRALGLFL